MNVFRPMSDEPEPVDLDAAPPSPPPTDTGEGGRGPRPPPERGSYTQYLPFLALGAFVIATERITLALIQWRGLPPAVHLAAAAVLVVVVGSAVGFGGAAFYRAYQADRRR